MSGVVEDMVNELESLGAIGSKVTYLKLKSVPSEPEEWVPPPPAAEEVEAETEAVEEEEEVLEDPPSEAELRETQLRVRLEALCEKADQKLAAVIEAVQDLRGVFQELHETTKGETHAEISEEA